MSLDTAEAKQKLTNAQIDALLMAVRCMVGVGGGPKRVRQTAMRAAERLRTMKKR